MDETVTVTGIALVDHLPLTVLLVLLVVEIVAENLVDLVVLDLDLMAPGVVLLNHTDHRIEIAESKANLQIAMDHQHRGSREVGMEDVVVVDHLAVVVVE